MLHPRNLQVVLVFNHRLPGYNHHFWSHILGAGRRKRITLGAPKRETEEKCSSARHMMVLLSWFRAWRLQISYENWPIIPSPKRRLYPKKKERKDILSHLASWVSYLYRIVVARWWKKPVVGEVIGEKISFVGHPKPGRRSLFARRKRDLRKENVNCGPRNHFLFPPFGSWALTYSSRISFPSTTSSQVHGSCIIFYFGFMEPWTRPS